MDQGEALRGFLERRFPTFASGAVPTGAMLGPEAREARQELESTILPELGELGPLLKHNSTGYVPADVLIVSRPTRDPSAVLFGFPVVKEGSTDLRQDFALGSTDGRGTKYYTGLNEAMRENEVLKHVNRLAEWVSTSRDYGAHQTPAGHWRISAHHPSTNEFGEDVWPGIAEALNRASASREEQ